jgi:hypothetical protein
VDVTDAPTLIALCDHERKARRRLDDIPVFRSCDYVKAGKDNERRQAEGFSSS